MLIGSTDFETIFAGAPGLTGKTIDFFGWHADALTLTCLLLFMGRWENQRSSCCTPGCRTPWKARRRSPALIHAATMVTAGVFMVARLSPLFELAPNAQAVVMFHRRHHRLLRGDRGSRAKRHQAYRGVFDLFAAWLMFVAMGAGAYSVGMFHLFTHAFFKALLFLGSGSVIYAMHHEQDIRNMGGLKDTDPPSPIS